MNRRRYIVAQRRVRPPLYLGRSPGNGSCTVQMVELFGDREVRFCC